MSNKGKTMKGVRTVGKDTTGWDCVRGAGTATTRKGPQVLPCTKDGAFFVPGEDLVWQTLAVVAGEDYARAALICVDWGSEPTGGTQFLIKDAHRCGLQMKHPHFTKGWAQTHTLTGYPFISHSCRAVNVMLTVSFLQLNNTIKNQS